MAAGKTEPSDRRAQVVAEVRIWSISGTEAQGIGEEWKVVAHGMIQQRCLIGGVEHRAGCVVCRDDFSRRAYGEDGRRTTLGQQAQLFLCLVAELLFECECERSAPA